MLAKALLLDSPVTLARFGAMEATQFKHQGFNVRRWFGRRHGSATKCVSELREHFVLNSVAFCGERGNIFFPKGVVSLHPTTFCRSIFRAGVCRFLLKTVHLERLLADVFLNLLGQRRSHVQTVGSLRICPSFFFYCFHEKFSDGRGQKVLISLRDGLGSVGQRGSVL